MPTTKHAAPLPTRFDDLVRALPPQAIRGDAAYDAAIDMIDRLMGVARLSKGQELYLETLVQLVQVYEAARHPIHSRPGIDALRQLLDEHDLSAADLARLLGVHTSMGSKILNRERALTIDHLKVLAARFKVSPETFMD